jgi:microsomal dipeptidase-like Zn-dependent dipeptidase
MVAPEAYPQIVQGLIDLGYSDDDLGKILGGNWLRVASQVWR